MIRKDLYIFIGPPGSGKGSLSRLCVEQLGLTQLSTGFLCRKHIAEKTSIGKEIDLLIKSGKLIPDAMIIDMVQDWLLKHADSIQGIIFDGFPRTEKQAKALQALVAEKLPNFTIKIVQLSISEDTVVQRLLNRSICINPNCQAVYSLLSDSSLAPKSPGICDVCASPLTKRDDDAAAVILSRLQEYKQQENELVKYYKAHDIPIVQSNVEQPLGSVFEEFKQHFGY